MDNHANRLTIGAKVLVERRLIEEERRTSMRGKIITVLTALLFAAASFVVPVQAAQQQAAKQEVKQDKAAKPKKAKKTTKKTAPKSSTKKSNKKAKPKKEKQA